MEGGGARSGESLSPGGLCALDLVAPLEQGRRHVADQERRNRRDSDMNTRGCRSRGDGPELQDVRVRLTRSEERSRRGRGPRVMVDSAAPVGVEGRSVLVGRMVVIGVGVDVQQRQQRVARQERHTSGRLVRLDELGPVLELGVGYLGKPR